jgi:uncharacterized cupredoxin-like copper-binding protein
MAMTVTSVGSLAMAATWLAFLVLLVPADGPETPALRAISLVFAALFGALGAAGLLWAGARRRVGFWISLPLLAIGVLLLNAPFILGPLTHPDDTKSFFIAILLVGASAAMIVGGFAAAGDAGRGTSTWSRTGRAGFIAVAVVGAMVGAVTTSALAGVSGGSGRLTAAPTVTGSVRAVKTTFTAANVSIRTNDVLGLFVVNEDGVGHQFDIDSLGIHASLPANATIVVAIRPTGPGAITYYCAIPGHREAGMVGTISVE